MMRRKCNQLQPSPIGEVCKLLKMVARDGLEQHYTQFAIPLRGIIFDPRLVEGRLCA